MVAIAVKAVAAAVVVPPTAVAEELVAAMTAVAEATRTVTPLATHAATTMPATRSMRSAAPRRLPKSATAMTSLPTLHDFAIYFFPRNSNLSGSPSMTQSKTQFSGSGTMPCPSIMLVATTT
jgi:hypothetical protein